jgi:hypothetical protein
MRHTALLAGALCAASLFAASPAAAGVTYFTVTGDADVSFSLDDSAAPSSFDADSFSYSGPVLFNGSPDFFSFTFYDTAFSGGIQIGPLGVLGPQLYSGTTADPTFLLGTYALGGYTQEESYMLTISDTAPGVPEPATWAMMLIGFGAIGFGMRAQRARPKLAHATL